LSNSSPLILKYEQYCVLAICFPHDEENVSYADGGVEDHLRFEPLRDVGFADDKVVVYEYISDGADDGMRAMKVQPKCRRAGEFGAFVKVVGAGMDRFEDLSAVFREAWRKWALEALE
jgi:hypothetical protein